MNRLDYLPLAGQIASMCFAMTMVILFFYGGLAAATSPEQGLAVGGIVSASDPMDKIYMIILRGKGAEREDPGLQAGDGSGAPFDLLPSRATNIFMFT